MKQTRKLLLLLALLMIAALSSGALAETWLTMGNDGLVRNAFGQIIGIGNEAQYEAWKQTQFAKGNAVHAVAYQPLTILSNGKVNDRFGNTLGELVSNMDFAVAELGDNSLPTALLVSLAAVSLTGAVLLRRRRLAL